MRLTACAALAIALVAPGCSRDSSAAEPPRYAAQPIQRDSADPFVTHDEHIRPGLAAARQGLVLRNPYEGNAAAASVGAKLFVAYNCIDCHGADGSGAMGPSLADGRWHFGGSAGEIYESIYQGRPEGMPAWGTLIDSDQIWRLVSYVQTLGAGKDPSTENFTGRTIARTGH